MSPSDIKAKIQEHYTAIRRLEELLIDTTRPTDWPSAKNYLERHPRVRIARFVEDMNIPVEDYIFCPWSTPWAGGFTFHAASKSDWAPFGFSVTGSCDLTFDEKGFDVWAWRKKRARVDYLP